jgi:excisionase family DNA binding protein
MSTALQSRQRETSPLTVREAQLLEEGGLPLPTGPRDPDRDPIARTIAMFETLLATSLTVPEAAARLGVHHTRIQQRIKNRTLYGIKVGRDWRLPAFQFTATGEVPNIGKVLAHVRPQIHPVGLATWLSLPDPDFRIAGHDASPLDWLRSGGNPDLVVEFARGLGSGQ